MNAQEEIGRDPIFCCCSRQGSRLREPPSSELVPNCFVAQDTEGRSRDPFSELVPTCKFFWSRHFRGKTMRPVLWIAPPLFLLKTGKIKNFSELHLGSTCLLKREGARAAFSLNCCSSLVVSPTEEAAARASLLCLFSRGVIRVLKQRRPVPYFFAVGAVGEVRCLSGGILWIQQAACWRELGSVRGILVASDISVMRREARERVVEGW